MERSILTVESFESADAFVAALQAECDLPSVVEIHIVRGGRVVLIYRRDGRSWAVERSSAV